MVREKRERWLTALGLIVLTLATRLPFRSHIFYEFDSIDFAIATFRYSLEQVTPHMPGYILHVLLGRALSLFTSDINAAFVTLSMLLSIGSVLFLWRAAATLRGERVGIMAALIWLTTPLFWFQGEVAAVYTHEAFWTAAVLYAGFKLIRHPTEYKWAYLLALLISLASAARQSSVLFFTPAVLYAFWKARLPMKRCIVAVGIFAFTTALWFGELLREAGGLENYAVAAKAEHLYKSTSVLFGNSWTYQFDIMSKVAFYMPIILGGALVTMLAVMLLFPKRVWLFTRDVFAKATFRFAALVALMPLLFYAIIYFMKAAYMLNILPSEIIGIAVLLDMGAIWMAERVKRKPENKLKLTRPIITRNAMILTGVTVVLNLVWFLTPWPGTDIEQSNNENTRNSFVYGATGRFQNSGSRLLTISNRAFAYTNVMGIVSVDSLNSVTLRALKQIGGDDSDQIIMTTWWSRWAYATLPNATIYDVQLDGTAMDRFAVGVAHGYDRRMIQDSVIEFSTKRPVILLARHDRPDFVELARQVHLRRLPMPEYLDAYIFEDSTFRVKWRDRTFVKR